MKTKKYIYNADIGSIRISTIDANFYFMNEYGDGSHDVYVCDEKNKCRGLEFKGTFEVKKDAWLMAYDCYDENDTEHYLCKLNKGRYFVYLKGESTFYICRQENE